jgi:hypothetical protein
VGVMDQAVEDGIGVAGVAEHGRVPQFLAGSCLISRSPTPIISFLDTGFRWCRSGRHAAPRTWL